MSIQYRLVHSGKTASGGCSAGQGSSEPVAPRIIIIILLLIVDYITELAVNIRKQSVTSTTICIKNTFIYVILQVNKINTIAITCLSVRRINSVSTERIYIG
jgi:hypothetical protein